MPETLTESFCERCGTRYTFESARQRVRLKRVKVLSRGVKNFVLSDSTSMDEAMASARAETDREVTTTQLDAFHQTFTFCMSCRQYTCSNCWNVAEERCLSCAPEGVVSAENGAAVLAGLEFAQPVSVASANGSNGHDAETDEAHVDGVVTEAVAEPAAIAQVEDEAEPAAALAEEAATVEAAAVATTAEPEAVAEVAPEPLDTSSDSRQDEAGIAAAAVIAAGAVVKKTADVGMRTAAQTSDLLRRFRPGQSIDAELEAYEREHAAAVTAVPAVATPASIEEAPPAAATPPTQPTTSTTPDAPAKPAPPSKQAAPAPPPRTEDLVVQPTWQRVAPDVTQDQPAVLPPAPGHTPSMPAAAAASSAASPGSPREAEAPRWPAKPEWPSTTPSNGLPFLGRPAVPETGLEGLWAASTREVITTPRVPGKPANAVQPCVSCGLSLSANARFCRRCGTSQA
jgi:hypothetical protein